MYFEIRRRKEIIKVKIQRLLISILLPFLAGGIGSVFTFDAIPTWYATLNKPFFNPPNFVFGPVWTTLYLLQGISLYLFWQSKKKGSKEKGFKVFIAQVILNALWSIIFFGMKLPPVALAEIVLLWIVIFMTIQEFRKFDKTAS